MTSVADAAQFEYNYCVASGVYNLKLPSIKDDMHSMIRETFRQAKCGVALNGISIFAREQHFTPYLYKNRGVDF